MNALDELKKTGLTAHAYLVRASVAETCAALKNAIRKGELGEVASADQFVREYETLSVDEVREEIAPFAHFKPMGERKMVVIGARSMLAPAQNALLKMVEEGSGSSVFFFVLEQGVPVLPTLESRCVVLKSKDESIKSKAGEAFLKMSYQDRLALAEKFAKDHDRESARELVRSLLAFADKNNVSAAALRDLLEANQFLTLSGSSPKAIIGHLALVL